MLITWVFLLLIFDLLGGGASQLKTQKGRGKMIFPPLHYVSRITSITTYL